MVSISQQGALLGVTALVRTVGVLFAVCKLLWPVRTVANHLLAVASYLVSRHQFFYLNTVYGNRGLKCTCLCRYDYDPDKPSKDIEPSTTSWQEEEQDSLRQSLHALQTQFATERARREEAEREAELLARENAELEQQLAGMAGCQVRLTPVSLCP